MNKSEITIKEIDLDVLLVALSKSGIDKIKIGVKREDGFIPSCLVTIGFPESALKFADHYEFKIIEK